ncbi:hypothetical protein FA15DRAFT_666239 [Coprinopsis marcescibilis]|uniref:Uncharacterized protein n=1 Tax=Coprinopsis marcescibilis TaxID=230819 RepID=A0A5C3L421_COPMA|nr:hypothetical protein FA15DRAFT_666239 [Coprinopsis marcescibilis]
MRRQTHPVGMGLVEIGRSDQDGEPHRFIQLVTPLKKSLHPKPVPGVGSQHSRAP